jgi:cell division protein FtsX
MSLQFRPVTIGMVTVFVAVFMLLFVFDSLQKLSDQCATESPPSFCKHFSSMTIPMLIVLLIIGGFVIMACATAYLILSPQ